MDVALLVLVLGGGAGTLAILGTGWFRLAQRGRALTQRTAFLRERFGCEYAHAIAVEGRDEGERVLLERLALFDGVDHPSLGEGLRDRYAAEWRALQVRIPDDPRRAVRVAEALAVSVMEARGFPVAGCARFDALSVVAPAVASVSRHANHVFCLADHGCALADEVVVAAVEGYGEFLEYMLELAPGDLRRVRGQDDQDDALLPVGLAVDHR